jgi:putative ABC transport system permease protein
MQAVIDRTTVTERFNLVLVSVLATLALALAAVGLYAVMAHGVAQRVREIGIRMALGARYDQVLRLVLREGLLLALAGVAAGLVIALGLTQVLSGMLFGISPRDPLTFAVVSVVLLGVACIASYAPARRASRVDPIVSLRAE